MWKSPLLEGSLNMPRFLFCVSRCETACGNAQLAPGMAIIHHVVLHLLWSRDPKPIIFRIEVSQRCFQTILFLQTMNNRTVIRSKIGPANCEQCFKYQNFHTRKLGGIAGFFAVKHTFSRIYSLSVMQISMNTARGVFSTVSNINCQTISKNCWHQKAVKCSRKTFGFVLLHHCCYSAVAVDAIPKEIVRANFSFILAVCGVSVHVWTVSHENGPRRNGCKSVYPFGVPVSWRRNTAYKLVFRYFV